MSAVGPLGQRLPASLIDERANANHQKPYCRLPLSKDLKDGYREVTYKQLANGINALAHLLDEHIKSDTEFPTFGWIGPSSDLRYVMLVFAAAKSKKKAFFPSPRNSMAAHASLLDRTDCHFFLAPKGAVAPIVHQLVEAHPMSLIEVPSIKELLDVPAPAYAYNDTYDKNRLTPIMVLHTSGSTGIPKPIVICNQSLTTADSFSAKADDPQLRTLFSDIGPTLDFTPFPLFHAAGIFISTSATVFWDRTIILAHDVPLTADYAIDVIKTQKPESAMLPPSIWKDIVEEPGFHDAVKTLRWAMWSGGALPEETGAVLSQLSYPVNLWAMTETGVVPYGLNAREDWQYIRFLDYGSHEFRKVDDGAYELWRLKNDKMSMYDATFAVFPDLKEWNTGDLWAPHPSKPGLMKIIGRGDDIIVFSNGEKLNPNTIQSAIDSLPLVHDALVFGQGRFQACLLVEPHDPTDDPAKRQELLEAIWPAVEQVNKETVAHGRISKDFITFTDTNKPFLRAAKGTVVKRMTGQLYEKEIQALYDRQAKPPSATDGMDITDKKSVLKAVRAIVAEQLESAAPNDDADLFTLGFDSLMASNLARAANVAAGEDLLKSRQIYNNPTIAKLASFIVSKTAGPQLSREEAMQKLYNELVSDLPISARDPLPFEKATVLLTGSTGSLGSYMLSNLLSDPTVATVYCFNRTDDAASRQEKSFAERGLDVKLLQNAKFLSGDLSKPYFSMAVNDYTTLLQEVTHVLHNAWPVNFNMSLDSFMPSVIGTRKLIDFSVLSTHGARIMFTSTISTAHAYASSQSGQGSHTVPEEPLYDWTTSQPMGYAESKQVCECLLATAGQVSKVRTVVCRVGQIAGPVHHGTHGAWNKQEFIPTLVNSSLLMGVVPRSVGGLDRVDWTPVDDLANVIVEATLGESGAAFNHGHTRILHAVNPYEAAWADLLPAITEYAPASRKLREVTMQEWVAELDRVVEAKGELADPAKNPAVKLQGFYQGLAHAEEPIVFDTTHSKQTNKHLDALAKPNKDWMALYLKQWSF